MSSPQLPSSSGFRAALEHLVSQPEVVGALVAARDGLPVAIHMGSDEAGESWAAMTAVLGRLAGQLLEAAEGEEMAAAVFNAVNHQFVVAPVPIGFLLAVAKPGAQGAALYERTKAAAQEVDAVAAALTGSGEG